MSGAVALACVLAFVPMRAAAGVGLICIMLLVSLMAHVPADPYYASSLNAWEQGRFIRFHGLARWIGWLWPYAALVALMFRMTSARDLAESVESPAGKPE